MNLSDLHNLSTPDGVLDDEDEFSEKCSECGARVGSDRMNHCSKCGNIMCDRCSNHPALSSTPGVCSQCSSGPDYGELAIGDLLDFDE